MLARRTDDRALVTAGIGGGSDRARHCRSRSPAKRPVAAAKGSVLASDAFFPFPDGLDAAIAAGVTAVAQPGGSKKDDEVVAAADRAQLAMVFTGRSPLPALENLARIAAA